jgi:hypothetical protein
VLAPPVVVLGFRDGLGHLALDICGERRQLGRGPGVSLEQRHNVTNALLLGERVEVLPQDVRDGLDGRQAEEIPGEILRDRLEPVAAVHRGVAADDVAVPARRRVGGQMRATTRRSTLAAHALEREAHVCLRNGGALVEEDAEGPLLVVGEVADLDVQPPGRLLDLELPRAERPVRA